MQQPRIPEAESMDQQAEAKVYAETDFSGKNDAFLDRLLKLAGHLEQAKVIDLCTGPADIPVRLIQRKPNWHVTAVDISKPMLKLAAERIKSADLAGKIELLEGDAKNFNLPRRFDIVTCNSALHHLADTTKFWQTAKSLTKPGGFIFVSDLFRPETKSHARDLTWKYHKYDRYELREGFYNSLLSAYIPDEIEEQLKSAGLEGFKVQKVTDHHIDVFGQLPIESL